MTILLAIGAFILAGIILIKFFPSLLTSDDSKNTSRPAHPKPKNEVANDKLVIVSKTPYEDVKKAIINFCNMYNQKDWGALPRLIKVKNDTSAITFPYDVEFELFCYFVNYVAYPEGLDISPEIAAWTTANSNDNWITPLAANKKVMLFLPDNDNWGDFVLMTTADNIGYKLGFALGEQKQLLTTPEKRFVAPSLDKTGLSSMAWEDIC